MMTINVTVSHQHILMVIVTMNVTFNHQLTNTPVRMNVTATINVIVTINVMMTINVMSPPHSDCDGGN